MYGDADPLDKTQWISFAYSTPKDERYWSEKTGICYNMYSGVNIKFLVAQTGEKTNPQFKIISALAEIITSDWSSK